MCLLFSFKFYAIIIIISIIITSILQQTEIQKVH